MSNRNTVADIRDHIGTLKQLNGPDGERIAKMFKVTKEAAISNIISVIEKDLADIR